MLRSGPSLRFAAAMRSASGSRAHSPGRSAAGPRPAPPPAPPRTPDQRVVGLLGGEDVGAEPRGAVPRAQVTERVPAGDQPLAAGPGTEQRQPLVGIGGVVEDDEYPPVGEQVT